MRLNVRKYHLYGGNMESKSDHPSLVNVLWAKKSDRSGRFSWLPLLVHLQDTMNVAGFLWNHWLAQGQRDAVIAQMDSGNEETGERLVRFLGGVHDIGKATPAFQTQKGFSCSDDLDDVLMEKLEFCGATGIRQCPLPSVHCTHYSLAGAVILKQIGVNDDIASIISGHHGMPADNAYVLEDQIDGYQANYYQVEDKNSPVYKLWKDSQEWICRWALEQSGILEISNLPSLSLPAQVILCGLVIMADWIASNESYFPLIDIDQDTIGDSALRFQNGVRKWFCDQPLAVGEPDSADQLFAERFHFAPRGFQKTIFNTIANTEHPGLVIIEAPTGCGKTEAALATAEQLAAKTQRSGLFFGLPTQATANSIFARVYPWLDSVVKDYDNTQSFRLQHGKSLLNPLMNLLTSHHDDQTRASNIGTDEKSDNSVIVNQWFSGRKTASLDDFVVGTVDQFLLVSLKQKHLLLRHLGFDKKVVIIDEVHAYDAYMQQYLDKALEWMGAYHVPVILLSATLPADKRAEFVRCYLRGYGSSTFSLSHSDTDLQTERYPLLTYTDGASVKQNADFEAMEQRIVHIKKISANSLIANVSPLLEKGGVIGVIVNTVRRAQDTASMLAEKYGKENVMLLHSSFIAADRAKIEDDLLKRIGKDGNRPERLIVVGTQVIEQSLDIDFDAVFTDLCPMDLLIQRIGRLQRHQISRPSQYKEACIYVMGADKPMEFESGSRHVYQEYLLASTQFWLPDEIRIPQDVSPLVQKVYDLNHIDPPYTEQPELLYQHAKEKFKTYTHNKSKKAGVFQIDRPSLRINPEKRNLFGWLNNTVGLEKEEEACAQVRDTEETIEVIAVRQYGSCYGFFAAKTEQERNLGANIDNPAIARKLAEQTIRLPRAATYKAGAGAMIEWLEEYNKNNLSEWQSQIWLKGALGIIFDENGNFVIPKFGVCLHYDNMLGLEVKKEEDNGEF